jgi:serine/threonine-protein kinase
MAEVLPSDELFDEPLDAGGSDPGRADREAGTRLGRYELLVPVARGGMARVWAARLHGQRGFQKLVAIKTILPHLAEEAEFERMFLDEARIASGVHHPNVCEIYELGEEKQTLYLVMEWVNGDSLARVMRATGKTEAIDARIAARVMADACAGLHAAHELTDDDGRALGVVHRDLSPHNILLTADGTAKVADFGVAKALGQLHEATSAGQLKGKIAYMAPEQVTGGAIDRRSDVFSLGCVLYEATTGQRPFRGDGDHQVMHAVLKGEVTPPTTLVRNYPQELERIVLRALSPQPILRYPTAERMRFALEEFLSSAPRGQLVTQSNVAQLVRARIGESIDKRKESIRRASASGDRAGGREGHWSEPPGAMTPSNQSRGAHRSGVSGIKMSSALLGNPLLTTLPLMGPSPLAGLPTPAMPPPLPRADTGQTQAFSMPPTSPMPSMLGMRGQPPAMPSMQMHAAAQPMGPPMFTHGEAPFDPHAPPGPYPQGYHPSMPPPAAGSYVAAVGVGVLLALLIGVGGFYAWHARHAPPVATTAGEAKPLAAGASYGNDAHVKPPVASVDIVLRLTPPDAVLVVDGQNVAPGARTVLRPAMGKTVTVVARAKDYEDVTVYVDFFTKSPLDVTMKPVANAAPPASVDDVSFAPAAPDEAPKDGARPKDGTTEKPRPHRPVADPALPPNPF